MNNIDTKNDFIGGNTFAQLPETIQGKYIESQGQQAKDDSELKKQKIALGKLGLLFGSKSNCVFYVTCLFLLICVLGAFIYTGYMVRCDHEKTHNQIVDFWKIITPLLTMALGYLFGVKTNKND